jgi:hypothetical protein
MLKRSNMFEVKAVAARETHIIIITVYEIGLHDLLWNYVGVFKQVLGCIQKFPDWVYNEIYACNNKHSLRSNTKSYGGKTH